MPDLAQVKFETLCTRLEREVLLNELAKGNLVKWSDVLLVFSEKIVSARNILLSIPAQCADIVPREGVERIRQIVNTALMEVSQLGSEDMQRTNKMAKHTKSNGAK